MGTLKGKNFRILVYNSENEYQVIGMSTNCTVTYTNNTENANHKDIVGVAQLPTVVGQACSISVESLDVTDAAAMLTAIKNMTKFTLLWDETSTTDNQTALGATFARMGDFYLNDCTFQFDNRTNSTKQLQFTSTGVIDTVADTPIVGTIAAGSFTKGQFVRLFLSSDNTNAATKVIAAAKTLSLHCSLTLEEATSKDTPGNYTVQEPTELAWDISTSALIRGGDTITSAVAAQGLSELETIKEAGTPVKFKIANVSGNNNRTAGTVIVSGSVIISQLTINGPLGAADYTAQLQGYGNYTVGS